MELFSARMLKSLIQSKSPADVMVAASKIIKLS